MRNRYFSLFLTTLILIGSFNGFAQQSKFKIPLSATENISDVSADWNPVLFNIEKEVEDEFADQQLLNQQKEKLANEIASKHHAVKGTSAVRDIPESPYVYNAFQGNNYNNSVPNDNEIAVSNSGYLISVMNSTIFMYDLVDDTSLNYLSLDAFSSSLGNTEGKYDPKVIYDPDENKFIAVFLAGFIDTASTIILAFSESDNPNGNWNFYELPGNPLNDTLWSDYPAIALTNHELFITVNHLHNGGSWQTSWVRSVIWQVNKKNGYAGDTLSSELHADIGTNMRVRNLCPVKGGSQLYGPDIYFLSERNLDVENDTFFLVHITDTIDAPSQSLSVQVIKSDIPYFVPVNAKQASGGDLATNDSRVLGAFYENSRIQFVGNTTDTSYGTAAFYHGIITDLSGQPTLSLHIISDDTIHFGYPNISYAAKNPIDQTAIINVLRSAVVLFPGYGAFVTDGEGNYSSLTDVKQGESYHSVFLFGGERWGDYSGSQRKYDEPGKVWVNGSYATLSHKVSTWIAEMSLDPHPVEVSEIADPCYDFNIFPNPSSEMCTVAFKLDDARDCIFNLYDLNGKLVRTLMKVHVSPGLNNFIFSVQPLASGTYMLVISAHGEIICSEKVIRD